MFIKFIKRPGHIKILRYLLEKEEDYIYSISKEVFINVGQTYTYLGELEQLEFLSSRKEKRKDNNRMIRIFSINKEKMKEIEEFVK